MPVIFSTHSLHRRASDLLSGHGDLVVATGLDAATLEREARDADVVIVRAPIPPALLAAAPRLKAAIRHGAGLDMIPIAAATQAGVLVANVPGANAGTVAEHVFFVAMALLRRFRAMDRDLRGNGWLAGREHANLGHDLAGRTLGIVGLGNVGRRVAAIASRGFGLTVLAASHGDGTAPDGVEVMDLDAMIAESDIVVLCCPLTPQTTGLLSRDRIAQMKQGAILVNVARGPVVDDDALIDALRDGRIGGAALDVFATQPLPADHAYLSFENVIVTPHMAGVTEESMMRMGIGAAEEAIRVLGGGLPVNLRNPEAVARYRQRFPG